MLYVTTRSKHDTYTEHYANQSDRGPDGGLYLPFRMPTLESQQILAMKDQTFGQRVAQILNIFYSAQLTGWDIELMIGKNPVKLVRMGNRIMLVQSWHNMDQNFAWLEKTLSGRICETLGDRKPTSWMRIAVRIAVLFGVYGELLADGVCKAEQTVDVSAATEDFSAPMAAWYARQMGLPIGNIVCSHDGAAVWGLIHQGEVRGDADLPDNLERLIGAALGIEEVLRYDEVCRQGKLYTIRPDLLDIFRQGMYASVVSSQRIDAVIPSVYRTSGHIFDPLTAMAYAGLQDYRAKTGESRLALLLSDHSPVNNSEQIAAAMEIPEQELLRQLGE